MPVTQAEIARRLGLNQRTVSIALGASGRIAEQTRRRVLEAAREMGYQPNHLAAGLRGAGTRSVGVIWAFVDPWAGDAVIGLDVLERVQRRGFTTYQAQHSESVNVLCQHLDDLLARRADAVVIQATPDQLRHPEIHRRLEHAPAVVGVSREPVEGFPGDLVVHDRYVAIREVVDHLARSGRRRPAMALAMTQESNPPKYEVFLERCRARGIAEHGHMLIDLDYPDRPESHGQRHREAMRRSFPDTVPVDAIFCFNDIGALYIMQELAGRGLRVPEDVAVVGFNDTEAGRVWEPPLATGDRKFREVAEAIDRLLARRLDEPDAGHISQTIHMSFIRRESAG